MSYPYEYGADGDPDSEEVPDIYDLESRIEDLENNDTASNYDANKSCLSFLLYFPGLVLAMILSYDTNRSIFFALLHGFLSWGYVIYRILF